jgi:hypothetical protein
VTSRIEPQFYLSNIPDRRTLAKSAAILDRNLGLE